MTGGPSLPLMLILHSSSPYSCNSLSPPSPTILELSTYTYVYTHTHARMSGGWSGGGWSREEEKEFENGIAMHWNEECKEQSWTKIASMVPTKSILELKHHYMLLLEDVAAIEAGNVPLPNYNTNIATASSSSYKDHPFHQKDKPFSNSSFSPVEPSAGKGGGSASRSEQERRKGIPWTEEEHRYFYTFTL